MESEQWVMIPGFNGRYFISDQGRIKSHHRVLKTQIQRTGNITVRLFFNGEYQTKSVHRLVAKTFIPNPENKGYVTHIDYDSNNYKLENLMWCTKSEIVERARDAGRFNINCNRVSDAKIERIKHLHKEGMTYRQIGELVGLTKVTIAKYVKL